MNTKIKTMLSAATIAVLSSSAGLAVEKSYSAPTISLEAAQKVAAEAIAMCSANGHTIAVTIVGADGRVKVQLVDDNAFLHIGETSYRKAFTAAARHIETAFIEGATQEDPPLAAIVNNLPNMISWGGGVPIIIDNHVIGGIGVAGAPGGDEDIKCVDAGLRALTVE